VAEQFFRDQPATLRRLSTFLAIDPFPDLPPLHKNPGRKLNYTATLSDDDAVYLSALFSDDIAAVETFLGRSIPEWRVPVQVRL
jgi:hypothetical protein